VHDYEVWDINQWCLGSFAWSACSQTNDVALVHSHIALDDPTDASHELLYCQCQVTVPIHVGL
jgi:hypothetical protein